jgi:hypothetical protein
VTGGVFGTLWTGADTGGARVPPLPLGGSATRTVLAPAADVVVVEPVEVDDELECPENPMAATAENTTVSTTETAALTRVKRETERMPLARTRPRLDRRRC